MPERKWHPVLFAKEYEPGRWVMFDALEKPFALIDFIRRGPELGYRATAWKQDRAEQKIIGYYRTLEAAAEHAYGKWIARNAPHHAPNSDSKSWPKHDNPWA